MIWHVLVKTLTTHYCQTLSRMNRVPLDLLLWLWFCVCYLLNMISFGQVSHFQLNFSKFLLSCATNPCSWKKWIIPSIRDLSIPTCLPHCHLYIHFINCHSINTASIWTNWNNLLAAWKPCVLNPEQKNWRLKVTQMKLTKYGYQFQQQTWISTDCYAKQLQGLKWEVSLELASISIPVLLFGKQ